MPRHPRRTSNPTTDALRAELVAALLPIAQAANMHVSETDVGLSKQNEDLVIVVKFRGGRNVTLPERLGPTTKRKSMGKGIMAFFPTLDVDTTQQKKDIK